MSCEYLISGGPLDSTVRQSLTDQWSALATLGAAAACGSVSNDEARNAWLDLLRTRSAHYQTIDGDSIVDGEHLHTSGGLIQRPCMASAELCLVLEGEMALRQKAGAPPEQSTAAVDHTAVSQLAAVDSVLSVQKGCEIPRRSRRHRATHAGQERDQSGESWEPTASQEIGYQAFDR
jgi:hypothetical protein